MQPNIKKFYIGICVKRIKKWLNVNENYLKINPIFSSKPPLYPEVSKTVQGCNQIDLLFMRSVSVTKDGDESNYNLSLLDLPLFTQSVFCIKSIYLQNFRCSTKKAVILLSLWSTLYIAFFK